MGHFIHVGGHNIKTRIFTISDVELLRLKTRLKIENCIKKKSSFQGQKMAMSQSLQGVPIKF